MLEDTFADIMGKARFGMGLSLSDLEGESSFSVGRLRSLEAGVPPTPMEIERLASTLKLDPLKLAAIAGSNWEPRKIDIRGNGMIVRRIDGKIGDYPVNGYLFIDCARREGALFDTGVSPKKVLAILKEEEIKLVAICITHSHADHIGGADDLYLATDAPIYLDRNELSGEEKRGVVLLEEEMEISVGRFHIRSLKTPGHTPGGTTYFMEGEDFPLIAFVGDALFAGSLGRAYAPSSYPVLLHSVRTEVLSLPKESVLFPGHGPATTVEEEQRYNPFFVGPF